jgi:two-component system response regulator WspF
MPFQIALAHHSEDALKILRQILAPQPDYVLAWTASTGPETQRKCRLGAPDMLLVDLALAGPDGARLVCDIMHASPCAVLILSDAIAKNAGKVFDAMGCGALDAIATPVLNKSGSVAGADALLKKLATIAKLLGNAAPSAPRTPSRASREADRLPPLVAIGSSTGGPKALAEIVSRSRPSWRRFPATFPPPWSSASMSICSLPRGWPSGWIPRRSSPSHWHGKACGRARASFWWPAPTTTSS